MNHQNLFIAQVKKITNRFIFKWHINDVGQAHKMSFYELGARHLYAI